MSTQASFLSIAHTKQLRRDTFLNEMNTIIPWDDLLVVIEPHYPHKHTERRRKELKMMLKIYFLQQWFDLSDPEAEQEIYDRCSFQKFFDIDLLSENVPDESTILNFRHLLEEHKLQEAFLEVVNSILEEKGFLMRKGTIVDATRIAAPSSTKNKEKKRDPEMHQTKKGNQWYFGMKGHIGVDVDSGIVHSVEGTAANVHLSATQRKKNRKKSTVRSKVEHPFRIIKDQWRHWKVRYRGIKKNTLQLLHCLLLRTYIRSVSSCLHRITVSVEQEYGEERQEKLTNHTSNTSKTFHETRGIIEVVFFRRFPNT